MKDFMTPQEIIAHYEENLNVCNKKIEHFEHPEIYGCYVKRCNSIVINKERMMVITTDETRHTSCELSPLYPTYFTPKAALDIVANDVWSDCKGNRIKFEIVGEHEYYKILKSHTQEIINALKRVIA